MLWTNYSQASIIELGIQKFKERNGLEKTRNAVWADQIQEGNWRKDETTLEMKS